ncbi:hypothetical protein V5O48_014522 [Marasmius crinis-equi]|uniref:Uncharacterized protein n=1 Tax=Marasmius crinis-equi TaxID=585013 RepID=A0ABR3EX25_9AGAR
MASTRSSTPTASSDDGIVVSSPENNIRPAAVSPIVNADATSVPPVVEPGTTSVPPIENSTTENQVPIVHSPILAKTVTWGQGSGGWGDTEDSTAAVHISQYARKDLVSVFRTTGLGNPTSLDKAPTPLWARTQLLRALPEAQHSKMPGPAFTISQLTDRRAIHEAEVQAVQRKIANNEERLSDLRDQQQSLWDQLAKLEKKCRGIDREQSDLMGTLESLTEVTRDLNDLEGLVPAYC